MLVIGGGITGAGVALDAAARGLRTALVEKGDFAAGTSSESSKLVHGGLRYLQQYEVGLVLESLAERQTLLHTAPHLVQPLTFVVPVLGKGGVRDRTVARTYSIGLWTYDLLGGFRIGRLHRRATPEELEAHLPTLRTDKMVAGFIYYDARADDARLTLTVARTAADHGAVVLNHAPVDALLKDGSGRVRGARVLPAGGPPGGMELRAKVVVNATGVWADHLRQLDGTTAPLIRPARGIHLAVPRAKLPCDVAVVLPSPRDGRNVFVIPWEGYTYVGTTDTDFRGSLDAPGMDADDLDYLLQAVNASVTQPVGPEDVTGTWSGLRPLLQKSPGRQRSPSARTADLSRRHRVLVSPSGLVTITGGKLTTYRKMADDTVDVVVRRLGQDRRRCPTRSLRLHGAPEKEGLRQPPGVPAPVWSHLVGRYGSDAVSVARLRGEGPGWDQPLDPGLPFLAAEVIYAARSEMATGVEDVLSRRMRVLPFDARLAETLARPVAVLLAAELGWDESRVDREVAEFSARCRSGLSAAAAMVERPASAA